MECSICYDIVVNSRFVHLSCAHKLCENCYGQLTTNSCPFCRTKFQEGIVQLENIWDAEVIDWDSIEYFPIVRYRRRRRRRRDVGRRGELQTPNNSPSFLGGNNLLAPPLLQDTNETSLSELEDTTTGSGNITSILTQELDINHQRRRNRRSNAWEGRKKHVTRKNNARKNMRLNKYGRY